VRCQEGEGVRCQATSPLTVWERPAWRWAAERRGPSSCLVGGACCPAGAEHGARLLVAGGEVNVGAEIMNRSGQAVGEALARDASAPCPGACQELVGGVGGLGSAAPTPALA